MSDGASPRNAIRRLVDRVADEQRVEIVELKVDTQNPRVRAVIDREPDGVTVDDCSRLNRALRREIDADERFDADAFHIEVMSPGVERRLVRDKDFRRFKGESVRVTLLRKTDGRRNLDGTLVGRTEKHVVLEVDGRADSIARDAIREVRLRLVPR